jgi:hypothetical protein
VVAPYCYSDQQQNEQQSLGYAQSIHGIFLGFRGLDAGNCKMMLRQSLEEQTAN